MINYQYAYAKVAWKQTYYNLKSIIINLMLLTSKILKVAIATGDMEYNVIFIIIVKTKTIFCDL